MATTPTYPSSTGPVRVAKQLLPADSSNIVDVYDNSLGAAAIKVEVLRIITNNTADRIVTFYIYSGSTSYKYGSVTVPDLSGTNGLTDPTVDVIARLGSAGADGVPCIWILAGCKLQASLDSALAADKTMDIVGRAITYA